VAKGHEGSVAWGWGNHWDGTVSGRGPGEGRMIC